MSMCKYFTAFTKDVLLAIGTGEDVSARQFQFSRMLLKDHGMLRQTDRREWVLTERGKMAFYEVAIDKNWNANIDIDFDVMERTLPLQSDWVGYGEDA